MSGRVRMAKGSKAIRRGQSVECPKRRRVRAASIYPAHRHVPAHFPQATFSAFGYTPSQRPAKVVSVTCKSLTCLLPDPACGTCRKKCRKCDRSRPICNRCKAKGLHCEGYPPKFQFCELATPDAEGAVNAAPDPAPVPALLPVSSPGEQINATVSPNETHDSRLDPLPSIGAAPHQSSPQQPPPPPPPPLWETDFSPLAQDVHADEISPPASDCHLLDDMLLSSDTQELLRYCKFVVFRLTI